MKPHTKTIRHGNTHLAPAAAKALLLGDQQLEVNGDGII